MSDSAISITNLSKVYKLYDKHSDRLKEALHPFKKKYHQKFFALKNLDCQVKKGEILGIVGRNGAGKSTLLKIITGILAPTSGNISVNGNISALLELGGGFNPEFTGLENIYMNGTIKGYSTKEMDKKKDEIISFAEIGGYINQPLKTYSSGMRARLGFAVAISMEPEILILDEVLSVGDELFRRKCYARMQDFFISGCTILFVSHSLSAINEICTRALLIDGGEGILEGPPKLVTMHYQKLLYAPAVEQKKIRDELIQLNKDEGRKKDFLGNFVESPQEEDIADLEFETFKTQRWREKDIQYPYIIPNFISKSTVKIQQDCVNIVQSRLATPDEKEVNALVMNEDFIYSYEVRIRENVDNVQFGMGIKSEKGVPLIWVFYPGLNKYMERTLCAGETYRVHSRFKCLLLPGIYYLEAAIRSLRKDTEVQLAKIVDDIVFKVQDVPGLNKGGIFDSYQSIRLERIP